VSDCAVSLALPNLAPVAVYVNDNNAAALVPGRSNTGAFLQRWDDELVVAVEHRIANVTSTRYEMGEELQVRALL
jgi:hypothetical protein